MGLWSYLGSFFVIISFHSGIIVFVETLNIDACIYCGLCVTEGTYRKQTFPGIAMFFNDGSSHKIVIAQERSCSSTT